MINCYEIHVQLCVAIVEYSDGRPPWAIPPLVDSYRVAGVALDERQVVLLNSNGALQLVDVDEQVVLQTIYSAKPGAPILRADSSEINYPVWEGGGIVRVRFRPFEAEILDQWTEIIPGRRYRLSRNTGDQIRNAPDFLVGGFDVKRRLVLFPPRPSNYIHESPHVLLLNWTSLEVERVDLPPQLDVPRHGLFSPCGRSLVRIRESSAAHIAPGQRLAADHPDLGIDGKEKWSALLEFWDLEEWQVKVVIPVRYLEERELPGGWLLDHDAGPDDVMWKFPDWFGIACSQTSGSLLRYQVARSAQEEMRVAVRNRLTYLAKTGASSAARLIEQDLHNYGHNIGAPHFYPPAGIEAFRGRVKSIAWAADGESVWVLFTDGAVRRIGRQGEVGPLVWFERFYRESWQDLGGARRRPKELKAERIEVRGNHSIRIWDSNIGFFGFTNWLEIDGAAASVAASDDGHLELRFEHLVAETYALLESMDNDDGDDDGDQN